MEIEAIVKEQRAFFETNTTKAVAWRLDHLRRLREAIRRHEAEILAALQSDLNKAPAEGYMAEVGMVLEELHCALKNVKRWAKPQRVSMPLAQFPAHGRIYSEPYGSVLIMSPWNYPFLLSMAPVVGAISAGNCFVLKPSAYSPATMAVLQLLISEVFHPTCGVVVTGGRAENQTLLAQKFDYTFFTGSAAVGKKVMEAAAQHLTPVSLELGGKSPCVVDDTADIPLAAKRIVWGKFLNAGQTCVAPDYLYVHESVKEPLLREMQRCITAQFGEKPCGCAEYPKIINRKHFERLCGLLEGAKLAAGGETDEVSNKIAPALLDDASWDDAAMQEEIFGPLLPVLTFRVLGDVIAAIKAHDKPLAAYLFTTNAAHEQQFLQEVSFGGGCVNDVVVQLASTKLPFGGVGASGMGGYHGQESFRTFSHRKSVLKKANWLDISLRYPPYAKKLRWIRRFLK